MYRLRTSCANYADNYRTLLDKIQTIKGQEVLECSAAGRFSERTGCAESAVSAQSTTRHGPRQWALRAQIGGIYRVPRAGPLGPMAVCSTKGTGCAESAVMREKVHAASLTALMALFAHHLRKERRFESAYLRWRGPDPCPEAVSHCETGTMGPPSIHVREYLCGATRCRVALPASRYRERGFPGR